MRWKRQEIQRIVKITHIHEEDPCVCVYGKQTDPHRIEKRKQDRRRREEGK